MGFWNVNSYDYENNVNTVWGKMQELDALAEESEWKADKTEYTAESAKESNKASDYRRQAKMVRYDAGRKANAQFQGCVAFLLIVALIAILFIVLPLLSH